MVMKFSFFPNINQDAQLALLAHTETVYRDYGNVLRYIECAIKYKIPPKIAQCVVNFAICYAKIEKLYDLDIPILAEKGKAYFIRQSTLNPNMIEAMPPLYQGAGGMLFAYRAAVIFGGRTALVSQFEADSPFSLNDGLETITDPETVTRFLEYMKKLNLTYVTFPTVKEFLACFPPHAIADDICQKTIALAEDTNA